MRISDWSSDVCSSDLLTVTLTELVLPVRGDAALGDMVHVARADLDLDLVTFGSDARGMQRLVAVRFLVGDVVVELAGYRLVDVMRDTERAIGIIDLVDDHAKAKQVGDRKSKRLNYSH